MVFTMRLSESEKNLAETYAKMHNMSLAEAFKSALFEKIDDEYAIFEAKNAYQQYRKSGSKSMPADEYWKKEDVGL